MDLSQVDLDNQMLEGSKLARAALRFTNFDRSVMTNVDFTGADLYGAQLQFADLEGADFKSADLQYANFIDSEHLQKNQVRQSFNWPLAFYGKTMLEELGLPANHNDNLEQRSFQGYF